MIERTRSNSPPGKVGRIRRGDRLAGRAFAGPSKVLVPSIVKDLTAGSGLTFEDRGMHALKGVPDEWDLFAVIVPPS
jgi:hypothetical protein